MATNNINDAFAAFNAISNIIEREMAVQRQFTCGENKAPAITVVPQNNNDDEIKQYVIHQMELMTNIVNDKVRELTVLIEQRVGAFEKMLEAKLSEIATPLPVTATVSVPSDIKKIANAVMSSVDKIEEKLNEFEAKVSVVEEPIPVPENTVVEEEEVTKEEAVEEEEAEEEEEEEVQDEEADELIEFPYKGKTYYMDSECNVYKLDENGDLVEDPIGIYNETTRKITFNS